jgi:hypothetical protein
MLPCSCVDGCSVTMKLTPVDREVTTCRQYGQGHLGSSHPYPAVPTSLQFTGCLLEKITSEMFSVHLPRSSLRSGAGRKWACLGFLFFVWHWRLTQGLDGEASTLPLNYIHPQPQTCVPYMRNERWWLRNTIKELLCERWYFGDAQNAKSTSAPSALVRLTCLSLAEPPICSVGFPYPFYIFMA